MMETKKGLIVLTVLFALLLGGCCKKKSSKNTEVAFNEFESEKNLASSEIPVCKDVEEFFVDEEGSQYAFLDDEFDGDVKGDVFEEDEQISQNELLDDDNFLEEENSFVAWDETPEENDVSFKTVHFDLNKNEIRADQKKFVEENIKIAKSAVEEGKTIIIQGHCCQLGSPSFNIPLSERRAQVIKKEMVRRGIPEEKIKTIGYGDEVPLVWSEKQDKKDLIKELAPNRRAELVIAS